MGNKNRVLQFLFFSTINPSSPVHSLDNGSLSTVYAATSISTNEYKSDGNEYMYYSPTLTSDTEYSPNQRIATLKPEPSDKYIPAIPNKIKSAPNIVLAGASNIPSIPMKYSNDNNENKSENINISLTLTTEHQAAAISIKYNYNNTENKDDIGTFMAAPNSPSISMKYNKNNNNNKYLNDKNENNKNFDETNNTTETNPIEGIDNVQGNIGGECNYYTGECVCDRDELFRDLYCKQSCPGLIGPIINNSGNGYSFKYCSGNGLCDTTTRQCKCNLAYGDEGCSTAYKKYESDRHQLDASTWKQLHDKIRWMMNSGRKEPKENLAHLPSAIRNL